jgi:hypothetical protein
MVNMKHSGAAGKAISMQYPFIFTPFLGLIRKKCIFARL